MDTGLLGRRRIFPLFLLFTALIHGGDAAAAVAQPAAGQLPSTSSIVRVIGEVGLQHSEIGKKAGFALHNLLQRTVYQKRTAKLSDVAVSFIVFVGNLFSFTSSAYNTAPSFDKLLNVFIRGETSRMFWSTDFSYILGIRDCLQELEQLNVITYWLLGSEELNLNQTMLNNINYGQPVTWIHIPGPLVAWRKLFISSGRSFDIFAQSPLPDVELPFSYYIDRLIKNRASGVDGCASHPVSPVPTQWDISRSTASRALKNRRLIVVQEWNLVLTQRTISNCNVLPPFRSAGMTIASLGNTDATGKTLAAALQKAAGVDSNCTLDDLVFEGGHWSNVFQVDGSLQNAGSISVREVTEHYAGYGKMWLNMTSTSYLTNLLYATANGDPVSLLEMSRNKGDVDVVGHVGYWSLKASPDTLLAYVGPWQLTPDQAMATRLKARRLRRVSVESESAAVGREWHPSCGVLDITEGYAQGVSQNDTDYRVLMVELYDASEDGSLIQLTSWRNESRAGLYLFYLLGALAGFTVIATLIILALKLRKMPTACLPNERTVASTPLLSTKTSLTDSNSGGSHEILADDDPDMLDIPQMSKSLLRRNSVNL